MVVLPGMEASIEPVLAAAGGWPGRVWAPFPARATRLVRQKSNLAGLAADAGLAVPRAWVRAPAGDVAPARIGFPCAVKSDDPVGRLSATRIVRDRDQLRRLVAGLPAGEPVLVQECVTGPLTCVAVVIDRAGALVARFQHVAHTTWPADAGPTARAVSVAPDDQLIARAARLAAAAGYWGLLQLDFLAGRGGPTLIDANPRFYPALALATACGVNLPAAWLRVITGTPAAPPELGDYRVGRRYRWLEADIIAALRGRPDRLLQRPQRPTTGAMWEPDDPIPAALLSALAITARPAKRLTALLDRPARTSR